MSKIFSGLKRLYLDSNILIYLVEGNEAVADLVLSAFNEIDEFGIQLVTSEMTMMECFHGPFRDGNQQLAEEYARLFSQRDFIKQVPIHREHLIEAAKIAGQSRLKTIDAIHFATAEASGCDGFLTNDKAFLSSETTQVFQLSQFEK